MRDRIYQAVAERLPDRLVYWAAIRLMAAVTTGPWADTNVPRLTVVEALERWGQRRRRPRREVAA